MDLKLPCAVVAGFVLGALLVRTEDPPAPRPVPGPAAVASPALAAPRLAPGADCGTREPVVAAALRAVAPMPVAGSVSETIAQRWQAELAAVIDGSGIAARMAEDPSELGDVLFRILLREGDVAGAERVLREHPDAWTEQWIAVAGAHRAQGDTARAVETYLEQFREDREEEDLIQPLLELAPERMLAHLESIPRSYEIDFETSGDYQLLAVLLHRVGHSEEARELIARLDEADELDERCFALLGEFDPDRVERILRNRTQLRGACGTYLATAGWDLNDHLLQQGRREEVIQDLFEQVPYDHDMERIHEYLLDLAPERWAEQLRVRIAEDDDPRDLLYLGDCELALGNEDQALEHWLTGMEDGAFWDGAERAFARDPVVTLARLGNVLTGSDDEFEWTWYGDLCWKAGRQNAALDAWHHARDLDPSDYDAFNRLERLALGTDPLVADEDDDEIWLSF